MTEGIPECTCKSPSWIVVDGATVCLDCKSVLTPSGEYLSGDSFFYVSSLCLAAEQIARPWLHGELDTALAHTLWAIEQKYPWLLEWKTWGAFVDREIRLRQLAIDARTLAAIQT